MTIERWEPFCEMISLREAMNSLLAGSLVQPEGSPAPGGAATLPLNRLTVTWPWPRTTTGGAREVGDCMTKDVVSVALGDSLESVATKFGARGFHRLLVNDSGGILWGIIAWSDVTPHPPDQTVGQFVLEAAPQPQGTDRG